VVSAGLANVTSVVTTLIIEPLHRKSWLRVLNLLQKTKEQKEQGLGFFHR